MNSKVSPGLFSAPIVLLATSSLIPPDAANDNGDADSNSPVLKLSVTISHEWKTHAKRLCYVRRSFSDPKSHPDNPVEIPGDVSQEELDRVIKNMSKSFANELIGGLATMPDVPPTSISITTRVYVYPAFYNETSVPVPQQILTEPAADLKVRRFIVDTYRPMVKKMVRESLNFMN